MTTWRQLLCEQAVTAKEVLKCSVHEQESLIVHVDLFYYIFYLSLAGWSHRSFLIFVV